jgi:hypothetical protein
VSSGPFNASFYAERIGQPAIGDLFDPRFMARTSDPETSKEAARAASKFAGDHHLRVLAGLQRAGGKAGAEHIGWIISIAPYAVRKRLPELETIGKVRRTGQTVLTRAGRKEQEWELVS